MPAAPCASPMRAPARCFPQTRAGRSLHASRSAGRRSATRWTRRWPGAPRSVDFHEPGDGDQRSTPSRCSPLQPPGEAGGFIARHLRRRLRPAGDRPHAHRFRRQCQPRAAHAARLADRLHRDAARPGPQRSAGVAKNSSRIMLDQARRMRRLIDDLLSLSRVEMRVHSRPTERVDLVAVLRQVRDALAPLAAEQSVVLSVEAPAEPVEVIGDRDELVQVFQNLVENAIRYGASGGRVEVSVEPRPTADPPRIAVHVQDYGPGIAGRASAAPDRALLPRRCRRQPRDEGHRARPRHRQAHPHPPSGTAGGAEPAGRGRALSRSNCLIHRLPSQATEEMLSNRRCVRLSSGCHRRCHRNIRRGRYGSQRRTRQAPRSTHNTGRSLRDHQISHQRRGVCRRRRRHRRRRRTRATRSASSVPPPSSPSPPPSPSASARRAASPPRSSNRPAPAAASSCSAKASARTPPTSPMPRAASRTASSTTCTTAGVTPVEVKIGFDGIVLANATERPGLRRHPRPDLHGSRQERARCERRPRAEPLRQLVRHRRVAAGREDRGARAASDVRHARRLRRARHDSRPAPRR